MLQLVNEGYVSGWDDRMSTIAGLRRRGITPEAIRTFSEKVGVAKANSRVDIALLEYCIRDDRTTGRRVMCVLRPLKVVITNYPEGQVEQLDAPYWPHDVPKKARGPFPSRESTSSGMTSWKIRPSHSIAWRRAGKCACAMRTSSGATR